MSRYSNRDQYIDPESGVLKNRLGIRDQALLDKAEGAGLPFEPKNLHWRLFRVTLNSHTLRKFTGSYFVMSTIGRVG